MGTAHPAAHPPASGPQGSGLPSLPVQTVLDVCGWKTRCVSPPQTSNAVCAFRGGKPSTPCGPGGRVGGSRAWGWWAGGVLAKRGGSLGGVNWFGSYSMSRVF